ncbi:MAG: hypothetical protein WC435_03955 [Candidatus Paceibacterota bacterium]
MAEFILEIFFFTGLAGLLAVASRAIPRIKEEEVKNDFSLEKWIESLPLHKIDSLLKNVSHKALRKLRLLILKIDNTIGGYLEKTKEGNGGSGIKVEELLEKKEEKKV